MSPLGFAIAVWIASVLLLLVAWSITDAAFRERHDRATGSQLGIARQFDRFVRDPLGAIKSVPEIHRQASDAHDIPSLDEATERLRRRSALLFLAVIVVGFGGLPASLLVFGVLVRLDRAFGLNGSVQLLIVVGWAAIAGLVLRRPGRTLKAVAFALVGLLVSILFLVVGMLE